MPTKKKPAKKPAKKTKITQNTQPLKKRVRKPRVKQDDQVPVKQEALLVVEQPAPDLTPKQEEIESQMKNFVAELKTNGGNVSKALEASGLNRKTAYNRLAIDREFAEAWKDALDFGYDDLFAEARARAVQGDLKAYVGKNGEVHEVREKSDTLLIFLMKNAEAQKKWRDRVLEMGRRAIMTLRSEATKQKVAPDTIRLIEEAMFSAFDKVPLV